MYDVYYTTGGGPWVNAGTDTWVNLWMELVAPKLDVKPILLIHRTKPKEYGDYDFPIEAHWHGDNIEKFEELCKGARRINILHGHYTPTKPIIDNSDKIHSNVLHNSVDHILKSQMGSDVMLSWHPYLDSSWEKQVNDWSENSIWVGLYEILFKNTNIPNFYEFKQIILDITQNNIRSRERDVIKRVYKLKYDNNVEVQNILKKTLLKPIKYVEDGIDMGSVWEKIRDEKIYN